MLLKPQYTYLCHFWAINSPEYFDSFWGGRPTMANEGEKTTRLPSPLLA
jgi:hypothetical protein